MDAAGWSRVGAEALGAWVLPAVAAAQRFRQHRRVRFRRRLEVPPPAGADMMLPYAARASGEVEPPEHLRV